jgi:hypothetical protein
MPFVEGFNNNQQAQGKQKTYSKVHSEPLLPNGAPGKQPDPPKKRRVLHTVTQPDGSVVGFCTEETDEGEDHIESIAESSSDQITSESLPKNQ